MATGSASVPSAPLPSVSRSVTSRTTSSAPVRTSTSVSVSRPSQPPPAATSTSIRSSTTTTSSSSTAVSRPPDTGAFPPAPSTTDSAQNGSQQPKSKVSVAAPIAGVAGGLILLYILYKLYQRRWRRKQEENAPLPPPRTPAIFENNPGRAVSFYGGPMSYETAILPYAQPVSLAQSHSSSFPSETDSKHLALSPGDSVNGTLNTEESLSASGRQSPLLPPPRRRPPPLSQVPRPQSTVSLSSRHSTYSSAPTVRSTGPLRGAPHLPHNRIDIVLPQPLAPGAQPRPYSGYSVGNRHSAYGDARVPSRQASREDTASWIERASTDIQSSSSCTIQLTPNSKEGRIDQAPPVPPLPASVTHGSITRTGSDRSNSPPQPLLSSAAFGSESVLGSGSGSASDHSSAIPSHPPPPVPPLPNLEMGLDASLPAVRMALQLDERAPPPPPK